MKLGVIWGVAIIVLLLAGVFLILRLPHGQNFILSQSPTDNSVASDTRGAGWCPSRLPVCCKCVVSGAEGFGCYKAGTVCSNLVGHGVCESFSGNNGACIRTSSQ